jgi:hypothetical protein
MWLKLNICLFLLLGNVGNEKMILGLQFLFGLVFYGFTYIKKKVFYGFINILNNVV